MNKMENELLQKIIKSQEALRLDMVEVKKDTSTIKRAIYGDPDNLVSGLIHRQVEDENRIKRLEDMKKKILYVTGTLIVVFKVVELVIFR